jgi:hypothetical protein
MSCRILASFPKHMAEFRCAHALAPSMLRGLKRLGEFAVGAEQYLIIDINFCSLSYAYKMC